MQDEGELPPRNGLAQEGLGPRREGLLFGFENREHHHGEVRRARLLAQRFEHRPAVHTGQDHVEQDEVGAIGFDVGQSLYPVLEGDQIVAERLEFSVDQLVLLPVWIATYQWKDKAHRLLVNGQTGKAIGSVPNSVPKILGAIALGLVVLTILFFVLRGGGS